MLEDRSRNTDVQVDVDPLTRLESPRRVTIALSRLIKRCESELRRLPTPKSRGESSFVLADTRIDDSRYLLLKIPVASSHSLTGRQLEVALFVAEGFSNKEIGQRLSISAATVAAHLRRVYEKLDVGSRTGILPALLHWDGSSGCS